MSDIYHVPVTTGVTAPTAGNANGIASATTVVDTSAAAAPSAGQTLIASSGTAAAWSSLATSGLIYVSTATADITTLGEQTLIGSGSGSLSYTPVAGQTVRIWLAGYFNNTSTGGPTVNLKIKKGSTVIASFNRTAAIGTSAATNRPWQLCVDVLFYTTTTAIANGDMVFTLSTTSPIVYGVLQVTAQAVSSAAESMDVTWEYGTTVASNNIHCTSAVFQVIT